MERRGKSEAANADAQSHIERERNLRWVVFGVAHVTMKIRRRSELKPGRASGTTVHFENRSGKCRYATLKSPMLPQRETMNSGCLEQLILDIAARFEKDLRKPRVRPAAKPTLEKDTGLDHQKQDHFARLLMAEAVRRLKQIPGTIRLWDGAGVALSTRGFVNAW